MISKITQSPLIPAATPRSTVVKFGTCSGTTITNYPSNKAPAYRAKVESISTVKRGWGKLNPVNHTKTELWYSTGPAKGTGSATNPPTGCSSTETWSISLGVFAYDVNHAMWPALTLEDPLWREYASEASRTMWPKVESLLSSLNFVYELPQVKRLLPDILRLGGHNPKNLLGAIKAAGSSRSPGAFMRLGRELLPLRLRSRTLKQLSTELKDHPLGPAANLSKGVLIYNYGIKPLFQDIVALSQVYSHSSRQLARLVAGQNQMHKSNFRKALNVSPTSIVDGVAWAGGGQGVYLSTRDYVSTTAVYHAMMQYSYSFPHLTPGVLKTFALLDALGINANPEIIWDLIPYSFVVDWFCGVSDFLKDYGSKNIDPKVTIHGAVHSMKRVYSIAQDIHLRADRTPLYERVPVKWQRNSTYIREPYVTNLLRPIVEAKKLTNLKVVLGSALIGAQIRRKKP